jgi:hypothetical protein
MSQFKLYIMQIYIYYAVSIALTIVYTRKYMHAETLALLTKP